MILNGFPVDSDRLKIVILSSPKTGNTWLRWLLHEAYKIQMVELPLEWDPQCTDDFPPRFVTHQHLFPSESLVQWLVESRAVVLTTIRHPADTFLSLFHYVKGHDTGLDPSATMLKEDGDRPGKNALKYITYTFPQIYAISLAWAKLGSHVVRYEDLLVNPLRVAKEVTSKIVPPDEGRLKAAVLLCKSEQLTRGPTASSAYGSAAVGSATVRDRRCDGGPSALRSACKSNTIGARPLWSFPDTTTTK
jgi:hypothetical protein